MLKLDSGIAPHTGQITPGSEASVCWASGIHDPRQVPEEDRKGDLSMPVTGSAYIQRWLKWVKFMYDEEKTILRSSAIAIINGKGWRVCMC